MSEAGMSTGSASRSTPIGAGGVLANILRSFAAMSAAAAKLFRPSRPNKLPEEEAESATVEIEAAEAEASEIEVAAVTDLATDLAADLHVDGERESKAQVQSVPDQQEIDRRRNLVRTFFNDFWSEALHKPAAFVERLDAAEEYLNERLAANGELWRLDATMRAMLGLPPRSNASVDRRTTG
jgi:hypothetical protein